MKLDAINIRPTCIYNKIWSLLTAQQNQVWSCSKYDEFALKTKLEL